MKYFTLIPLLIFLVSCAISPTEDELSVEEKALISLMVKDYDLQEQLSQTGSLESDDLTGNTDSGSPSPSSYASRAVTVTKENTYLLPDGTELFIQKVVDDGDTPETTSDDKLTISRSYYYDSELWKREEIIRPLKPESDWDLWNNDQIVQEGEIKVHIGDVIVGTGTLQACWSLEENEVILTEVHKSSFNIVSNIKRVVDILYEEDLTYQTIYKYFWNGRELIEISAFTALVVEIDGELYTKLINDDESYILIKQKCSPVIREYYDSEGQLYLVETIGKNGGLRTEVTRDFYEDGVLVSTKDINISYSINEDSVTISRRVDSALKKMTIEVSESGEGYLVERNGSTYQVVFSDSGSVLIYSESGDFMAEITTSHEDSAVVTESDGSVTTVSF